MMNNKVKGSQFEGEFCRMLFDKGFWAHRLQDNKNGQPFDVIAARHGATYVFDCKDCMNDYFAYSRIEENQDNAMWLWQETGNRPGMFAIRISEGVYLVGYELIKDQLLKGIKGMNKEIIMDKGLRFGEWVKSISEFNDKQRTNCRESQ